jgi:hypothetical protein
MIFGCVFGNFYKFRLMFIISVGAGVMREWYRMLRVDSC